MEVRKRSSAHAMPFQLSLHVRHPSVDPPEISQEFGLEAVESFRAGEPRESRSGLAATSVHVETYWVAVLDPVVWSAPVTAARRMPPTAQLPGEAKVLRARFGLEEGEPPIPGSLGWGIVLVCHCLLVRHGRFLAHLREQGGSITLFAAVEPESLVGLRITPEMGRQLHDLGLTVKIEVPNSRDFSPDLN
jgi:hypothetical protein